MANRTTDICLGLQYVSYQSSSDRVSYNTDSSSAHQIELLMLGASQEYGTVEPNISSLFSSWLTGIFYDRNAFCQQSGCSHHPGRCCPRPSKGCICSSHGRQYLYFINGKEC